MIPLIVALEVLLLYLSLGAVGIAATLLAALALVTMYLMANRGGANSGLIPLDESEMKWLHEGIVEMSKKAGTKVPAVYLQDDYIPNAYSFGGNIVLSLGLFEVLDEDEILAVAAHELGHIKNGDTKLFPMVTYGRYLMLITTILLMIGGNLAVRIIAPLLYISYEASRISLMKKREFMADDTALRLLPTPMSLKRALEEMKYYEDLRADVKINALPSIEPSIERDQGPKWVSFVETHPSYEERITRITMYITNLNKRLQ
ncbi:zinc-dependent protease HtpX homolog, M48 family [Thermococcus kodakarensis KOD1]|uniref:Zinc-dependent protease HtpX homolog, M48 family n=1 Tax=Thermococcus kodakarensis (strain ATCC BAA-918 / JCM 12380 / KOD1) TaxID=69014 RepID=Q5JHR9_THEKO|nr:M48 family metalloprotease [Thermococcus kodakarensis]WCN28085.1 M48 family metalloprotease [Thermococcus kodakarensis]WCN30382.1 M48 family metalloprotease [Thermococcus kodakarensis]BAD86447.1 zinc-dependent protease HtpX homolog, M48 family [Thermococcus kodakarensis KOD1]